MHAHDKGILNLHSATYIFGVSNFVKSLLFVVSGFTAMTCRKEEIHRVSLPKGHTQVLKFSHSVQTHNRNQQCSKEVWPNFTFGYLMLVKIVYERSCLD